MILLLLLIEREREMFIYTYIYIYIYIYTQRKQTDRLIGGAERSQSESQNVRFYTPRPGRQTTCKTAAAGTLHTDWTKMYQTFVATQYIYQRRRRRRRAGVSGERRALQLARRRRGPPTNACMCARMVFGSALSSGTLHSASAEVARHRKKCACACMSVRVLNA